MAAPRVPAPVSGVDVLSLPLSTTEGFVLSRVDGSTSVDDISMMSGIDKSRLLGILERLAELGAVRLSWYQPAPKPAAKPALKAERKMAGDHFAANPPRYLASELDAPGEIPVELKRRILDAFYGIDGKNYYQLLGVRRDAERAEIRTAYFELSKVFHPDSLFGKELYSFKPKMETVFKRLTEAYEVLGKKKKRAEYDEYLGTTERTQGIRDTLEAAEQVADALRRSSEIPKPPAVPAEATARDEPDAKPRGPDPRAARASLRAPRSNAERRARVRDRLRRKLKSASSPPPSASADRDASPPPEPSDSSERRRSVIEGLRNSIRASAAVSTGGPDERVAQHRERARQAEKGGDVLLAASELQLAMALDPQDAALRVEYERVSQTVAAQLAENYEKQARYEEKTGNWKAAATSWARVADGRREDADAARGAANAMLKASTDLHRAQKYAERAVRISPDSVANLVVLARVYLAAGLKRNAKRELEKAAKLDPKDEIVKNLLRDAS